jgi:uncharacterized protein (TIGR01319 family)
MGTVLCVDFGSTFTKAALIATDGTLIASGSHPTTLATDVLDGYRALRAQLTPIGGRIEQVLACSSAGGGLRLAVVGYERVVTAEAGYRVGLSAGAKVVHRAAGPLTSDNVAELRASRPDVVLLVGGTDGGNAEVLLHNARQLASQQIAAPVVVAGNAEAAPQAAAELTRGGLRVVVAANVLPRIGVLDPLPARAAIREVFLQHVIGGKGLSRGPEFAALVRAPTPDAVLAGVGVLAADGDVLVVDVGGATTDVYSALTPEGEDATLRKEVVGPLWHARTVEGDLGMRWNAPGIVAAAVAEGLLAEGLLADEGMLTNQAQVLTAYAQRVQGDPTFVPPPSASAEDLRLAELAVTIALRRHGRPGSGGPRPLREVQLVVGSGGVLRHHNDAARAQILRAATSDHGGGWRVPAAAQVAVDDRYLLFAAGLLVEHDPAAAAALVRGGLRRLPPPGSVGSLPDG